LQQNNYGALGQIANWKLQLDAAPKKDAKQTPAALTETLAKLKANETKGKQ